MSKAEYAVDNLGHFGLGSQNYTHFTSPIRRYPDLLVHRIFWMYLFNRHNDKKNEFSASLKKCCDQSSKCELIAIKCERDVNAMKFAEYMERHIGDEFDGFVTSVSPYAVFVQLSNTVEGIIKIEDLKNDYYVFNEQTNELIGRRTNLKFTLGTKVRVKVIAANKLLRKINFELVRHLGNR
jgi:ribonuclease R